MIDEKQQIMEAYNSMVTENTNPDSEKVTFHEIFSHFDEITEISFMSYSGGSMKIVSFKNDEYDYQVDLSPVWSSYWNKFKNNLSDEDFKTWMFDKLKSPSFKRFYDRLRPVRYF